MSMEINVFYMCHNALHKVNEYLAEKKMKFILRHLQRKLAIANRITAINNRITRSTIVRVSHILHRRLKN